MEPLAIASLRASPSLTTAAGPADSPPDCGQFATTVSTAERKRLNGLTGAVVNSLCGRLWDRSIASEAPALLVMMRREKPHHRTSRVASSRTRLIAPESAKAFGRIGGPLVGVGMMGAIVFGVWLAIDDDAYQVWDGWILASLILWAIAGALGGRAGQAFEKDPVAGRAAGIRYQALTSVAIIAILLLMIWKPGA